MTPTELFLEAFKHVQATKPNDPEEAMKWFKANLECENQAQRHLIVNAGFSAGHGQLEWAAEALWRLLKDETQVADALLRTQQWQSPVCVAAAKAAQPAARPAAKPAANPHDQPWKS